MVDDQASKQPLNVVLIDDDRDLLETYEDGLLAIGGFSVRCAEDAVTAMRMINADHPDVVVVDLNLPHTPRGTIIPFVRGLRGHHKMEILILSGVDNVQEIAKMWGITNYLSKPVTIQQLVDKLQELAPREA